MIGIEFVEELMLCGKHGIEKKLVSCTKLEGRTSVRRLGAENLPRRICIKSLNSMLVRGRMNDNLYHAAVPHGRF